MLCFSYGMSGSLDVIEKEKFIIKSEEEEIEQIINRDLNGESEIGDMLTSENNEEDDNDTELMPDDKYTS